MIAMLALLLSSLTCAVSAADTSPFDDVKLGKWYSDAVITVYENGIMEGMSKRVFAPFDNMTRAQLVMILSRIADADVTGCASSLNFKDVKKKYWYSDAIGWAVSEGLVTGYSDNTFKPDDKVLRQELAVLFARFLDSRSISLPEVSDPASFTDSSLIPKWAADGIEKMRLTGIVTGDELGRFNPTSSATRAEIAMMLVRYLNGIENAEDPMYAKFENIKELVRLESGKIAIDLYLYERFTDCGHENSVSEQLLPQMGLDTDVYEMVTSSDSLVSINETITHSHMAHEEEADKLFYKSAKFFIRNKQTGECTETKSLGFTITRHVTADDEHSSFDSGLTEKLYSEMMEKSLHSTGNIARFAQVFAKAERGEDITVGYIGGSITQGAISGTTRQHCWARIAYQWLQRQFPDITVNYVNAGIGGTCSNYGLFRSEAHLFSYEPDIVFIEFSVNDGGSADGLCQYYETLIRRALGADNSPAVALIISETAPDVSIAREYRLAEYYGLPVVNVDEAIDYGISSGEFTFKEFAPDGVHPYEWGHRVMADMLINMYEAVMALADNASADELTVQPIPESTLCECSFTGLSYIGVDELPYAELGTWSLETLEYSDRCYIGDYTAVLTGKAGDTMSFKLRASSVTLLFDSANATVSVNGVKVSEMNDSYDFKTVYESDSEQELTVVISATGDCAIRAVVYN